ncbi:MAG TPA: MFS transporter [Bryobacteraceae bacterium]|nr:MFS transporter [Bryobacteraceae bacterium]
MSFSSYWRILRENRNFRLLWTAQIVSELGDWFYSIAIFTFLLELTGSAQMVALAFLMQVLPQTFMAPTAGVINDRVSRRRVMILADCARAGIVLAMMLVRTRAILPLLYVLLAMETVCWAMFEPARSAVIPNIAKDEEIPVANALSSATWSINFAMGAAFGGLVLVSFGRPAVFIVNSLSFVVSALLIRSMRFAEPHAENLPPLKWRDLVDFSPIAEGLRYVRRDPKLLSAIFVKGGIGLAGSNWVILPVLGERVFRLQLAGMSAAQAGALGMSVLLASRGAGAILGSFLGGNFAGLDRSRLRWTILAGFSMIGAGYVALGSAGSLMMAVLSLLLAHAGGSACWAASATLLQMQTDDRFRGRVFSAEVALSMLALSISSFAAGRAVDAGIAVRTVAAATGALMLVPATLWLIAGRAWREPS